MSARRKPFAFVVLLAFMVGCYTTFPETRQQERRSREPTIPRTNPSLEYSIVDGTIAYHRGGNTRETKYHPGFILINRKWILNPPPVMREVMYLRGPVDSSYMNRFVRIHGSLRIPKYIGNDPVWGPDYTSEMTMIIDSIEVIH
jgi:hypothetical protein